MLQSDLSGECDIVRRADLIHCSASTFTFPPGNSSADVASAQRGPPLSVGQAGTRDEPCVYVYAKQSLYEIISCVWLFMWDEQRTRDVVFFPVEISLLS